MDEPSTRKGFPRRFWDARFHDRGEPLLFSLVRRTSWTCFRAVGGASQAWIRAIPVISVDRHFGKSPSREESRDISTVTVSVSPEEGRLLAAAGREGRIHWFLRNPAEPSTSAASGTRPPKPAPVKIEIWKAGMQELHPANTNGEPG